MTVEVVRSGVLGDLPHGFLGRLGGVSQGEMWGLNVGYGSGDDPELIAENRRRAIAAVMPGATLATVHQVHSPTVVYVEKPWEQESRPHADAMVTDRAEILLGVLTADCAPVLFADEEAGVVAAAHSGWRGAIAGVNEATIEAMEQLGARRDRIAAAVGPSVEQRSMGTTASSSPVPRASPTSISPATSSNASTTRASRRRRPCVWTPIPTPTVSTAIGARPTGTSLRTADRSA